MQHVVVAALWANTEDSCLKGHESESAESYYESDSELFFKENVPPETEQFTFTKKHVQTSIREAPDDKAYDTELHGITPSIYQSDAVAIALSIGFNHLCTRNLL